MDIIFFDEILETHTCESLKLALINRGHKAYWTGKIWQGHQFPANEVDTNFIWEKVNNLIEQKPDVIFNFRASSLLPEMIIKLKNSGIHTIVWLPDDPVLYHICYRHIVEFYDTILHCGDAHILNFYEEKHGRSGFNFPFWTDASFFPFSYNPENTEYDLVFLGNCVGQVKRERYKLIASLPGKKRIFGKVSNDDFNLCGGFIKDTKEVSQEIGKGLIGLNIPQYFRNYGGTNYDFPELNDLGFFQYPSRIIQYAACGLPIISLQPGEPPTTFPELITVENVDVLTNKINDLIENPEELKEISEGVYRRFCQSFSAESRALFLENILANNGGNNLDTRTKAELFSYIDINNSDVVNNQSMFKSGSRRVLICTQNFKRGGLETRLLDEITWLKNNNISVVVACGGNVDREMVSRFPSFLLIEGLDFTIRAIGKSLVDDVEKLREIIRKYEIDHVYIHPFASIIPGVIAAELEQKPRTLILHGIDSVNPKQYYGDFLQMLWHLAIFPAVEEIVTVSANLANLVKKACPSVREDSLTIVPNGVDCSKFLPATANKQKNVILVLSRLDGYRAPRIMDLLKLLQPTKFELHIAGDGPGKSKLEAQVTAMGMGDRVKFLGFIYDPPSLLSEYAYVSANGRAFLEAAASGCVCIFLRKDLSFPVEVSQIPELAYYNFSRRNFEIELADEDILDLLENAPHNPAYDLSKSIKEQYHQPNILTAWGFPERSFNKIPHLIEIYNIIIHEHTGFSDPFLNNFRVVREVYRLIGHLDVAKIHQKSLASDQLFAGIDFPLKISETQLIEDLQKHKKNGGNIVLYPLCYDWNIQMFQRPQQIAIALAKCGAKVIYVSRSDKNSDSFYELDTNLFLIHEFDDIVNLIPSSWIIIYSQNQHYQIVDLMKWRLLGHRIVYEYIDHIDAKISGGAANILSLLWENISQESVDLFIATANVLREELAGRFPSKLISLVPNGVDAEFYFSNAKRNAEQVNENFQPIVKRSLSGRKIVGYFGTIAPWLDYNLISGLVLENPAIDFVFIGPVYGTVKQENLPNAENLFWVGLINHHDLPKHAVWFDVCLIPFEAGQIAKTTSPLKLYEYFALGKPVVVTDSMLECTQYDFVFRGGSVPEVSTAISEALVLSTDEHFIQFLKEKAEENSWKVRAKTLLASMDSIEVNTTLEKVIEFPSQIQNFPDPVFALDISEYSTPDTVKEITGNNPILGVNLRPWKVGKQDSYFLEKLANAFQQITAEYNCILLGIPMQDGKNNDEAILRQMFEMVDSSEPKIVLNWTNNFAELFGALKSCQALVSMRLHSCLLGHRLSIPTVGLAYDPKVSSHFQELGRENFSVPLDISVSELVNKIKQVMDLQGNLPQSVKAKVQQLESQAREGIKLLGHRLNSITTVRNTAKIINQVIQETAQKKVVKLVEKKLSCLQFASENNPNILSAHWYAPPKDPKIQLTLLSTEKIKISLDLTQENDKRYITTSSMAFNKPPKKNPDWEIKPSQGYYVYLNVDFINGNIGGILWLIEYSESDRLKHTTTKIKNGETELEVMTHPNAKYFRVAIRLTGSGVWEVEKPVLYEVKI